MEIPGRGQIWLVNLDPTIGSEIRKIRPAVIISNEHNNQFADTVTVIPITDAGHKIYSFEIPLSSQTKGLTKESKARCQQIRTVDKRRLLKMLGFVENDQLEDIEKALLIHSGIESNIHD